MTRADVRTFAWMLPITLVLMFAWMFRADPCLDDRIAANWRVRAPSAAEDLPATPLDADVVEGDMVAVENPYGLVAACDYFPSVKERVMTCAILLLILLCVGFLCARNFQHHAGRGAAVVVFTALCLVFVFNAMTHLPDCFGLGTGFLLEQALIMLLVALVGGALAWLAALLTLRWRARE